MLNLRLYYKPMCPFCIKVLKYLHNQGITILLKDISSNSKYEQELIALGEKKQVPCLVIDGKAALYESDDIIQWFEKHHRR